MHRGNRALLRAAPADLPALLGRAHRRAAAAQRCAPCLPLPTMLPISDLLPRPLPARPQLNRPASSEIWELGGCSTRVDALDCRSSDYQVAAASACRQLLCCGTGRRPHLARCSLPLPAGSRELGQDAGAGLDVERARPVSPRLPTTVDATQAWAPA